MLELFSCETQSPAERTQSTKPVACIGPLQQHELER
jgi:hypothetical protein